MGISLILARTPSPPRSCRDPNILHRVARFPICDYHLKPLAPDRLAKRLHTLLEHPRLRFSLAEQTARLECLIARRTGGRVRGLHVEEVDGRVIVHGRCASYHVRQLALEAFEASESQSEKVELDIDVPCPTSLCANIRPSNAKQYQ